MESFDPDDNELGYEKENLEIDESCSCGCESCMAGPDPLWRKSFHLFGGLFDYQNFSIIGDWEMWIRMSRMGLKFKLIPHVLCIYVDHENTVSNSSSEKLREQQIRLKQKYS